MIDPTNREALEDLLTRYVLGELDDTEARELARLVTERSELAAEIDALRRALGMLPYADVAAPPPHLRARVLAAAEAAATHSTPATDRPRTATITELRRPPRMLTAARVMGAIAATLIVALAWDGQRLRQELELQRDVATTLQQPNVVRQFALTGSGFNGFGFAPAAGTAVLDLDAKRAAVVIRGLPRLPAGQVYRLWARIGDGAVPCGQFNADEHGAVVSQFTIPVDAYTSPVRELFLNVEPAAQGAQPVGETVMRST
jgi:anti-sigma factor RsiW